MPWGAPVNYNPFTDAAPTDAGVPGISVTPPDAPPAPAAPRPGAFSWEGVKSAFTGAGRTEFPDAPEFTPAYAATGQTGSEVGGADLPQLGNTLRSAVTPDPEAQFDILAKSIPGLERKTDQYGNLMLKAPGMADFAYLNKPGLSARDVDEFGTQTLATLPLMGMAAPVKGAGALMNIARGGAGLAASSVAQDVLAGQAGSEQGIDTGRAELAAGLGAALPAAGALMRGATGLVSGGYNAARQAVRGVADAKGLAREEVQAAFNRDTQAGGLGPENAVQQSDIPQMAARGQDYRVADFGGENVRTEARKAANFSSSARDDLMRAIGPRFESQAPRTAGMVENELGFNRSALTARTELADAARTARAPLYKQAFQAGKGGIDSPTLQQLQQSPTFQRAMGSAEHRLADQAATPGWVSTGATAPNGQHTLEFWDQVKQTLDDYAGEALRSGQKARGGQLAQMAKDLRNELDAQGQAGKLYSHARGVAMQFFKSDNALEAGGNFAKGSFNFQDAAHAVAQLTAPEKKLFAEGFADDFVQKIRATPDRSSVLNRIMNSPMEQERVKIAIGQGKYDQLDGFLRLEGIMDRLRTRMGNSTSAEQAAELMKGYGAQAAGTGIGTLGYAYDDPKAMILGAIMTGGRAAQLRINAHVADEVAKLLTSKNPDVFLKGLQSVGKAPISTAIRAFDNLLADAGVAYPAAVQGGVNASRYPKAGGR